MRPIVLAALAVVALLGVLAGVLVMRSHRTPPSVGLPTNPRPTVPGPRSPEAPPAAQDIDLVRQALEDALRTATEKPAASPFPEGTRLAGVKLEGDLAIVDLTSEFGNVANQGNSAESAAQHALRGALARCPEVKRMRVLVDGKPFEGEHSGPWDDVPVRDDAGSRP